MEDAATGDWSLGNDWGPATFGLDGDDPGAALRRMAGGESLSFSRIRSVVARHALGNSYYLHAHCGGTLVFFRAGY